MHLPRPELAPHITHHALKRYRERVEDIPDREICMRLSCPAICAAIAFGVPYVRLSDGQRVVLDGANIVTVLPRDQSPHCLGRRMRQ